MQKIHFLNNDSGTTLVEVIVAIAISAVAIVGLTDLFINGFDAYNLSRGYTAGVYLAQEKIAESGVVGPTNKNMDTERLQEITYRWERKYFEKDGVPAGFVQVEVLVKWSDSHGDHNVSLTTLKPK
ncbi:MAG: prepilin-type N-terminal cleavage/methylation domain-containing protein [bacterium]|nr:prepilin-type N-terminal cleavage/methylation domain-containing protein [bacterium]